MVIITEVNSFVDLVIKATNFANQLQDGWYKGSAEVDSFKAQIWILRQKHDQWSAQLQRHGVSEDERLLRAVQAAVQVLQEQEQYLSRLQKNPLLRLRRKAFPGQLTYSLKNVSDIVDAGPQLLAARVATFDVLERIRAQTPAPLPFLPDLNYVPISESILAIRKALEDEGGPRVVSVFGGPGLGKSSVAKYLALQYQEERKQGLLQTQRKPLTFPDGVYYLYCGKDAHDQVKQLQLKLLDCLGFGPGSSAPLNVDPTGSAMQEGAYLQLSSHQLLMKLRSRLAEQMLLIVLDDLWEREVLQELLVPAKGVRYLITSQMKEIWGPAARIQLRYPTFAEARQIMSNYTNGLPLKGQFPHNIQSVTDAIIENVGSHPLCLAKVGSSINSSRATDMSHWKAKNDSIHLLLHEVDEFQGSPVVMYEQSYQLEIGASMMLMVDCLHPNARGLLFLIALLGGEHLPETLVRYFYKWIHPADQSTDFHLKYENLEKYLADRSLVDLHMQPGNELTWDKRTLVGHCLRMHYIREKKALDVRSIAVQILESSNDGATDLSIQKGDAEATLVTIFSAIYFRKPFTDVAANTLEKHFRILDGGTIPRNMSRGIDPHDLLRLARSEMDALLWLINIDHRDPDWKRQAHGYAKKIIIKLACQGKLDDYSMAGLLQLPQTTSVACAVLDRYAGHYGSHDSDETVSSRHGETMNTLLALLHDDDIAVAQNLCYYHRCARRAVTIMGEFTRILDVLILLVSAKDYKVRVSAAKTTLWLCRWKCTSLKVAAIPHALEMVFNLFRSAKIFGNLPFSWGYFSEHPPCWAGYILGHLSHVEENTIKFRALKSGLDGLGNIVARLKGTWQATDNESHRRALWRQASIAAGILDHLALDKELRDSIASLPGLEEGLLFLQLLDIARIEDPQYPLRNWLFSFKSTRALTKLCYTSTNPRLREVPSVKQVQEVSSIDKFPPNRVAAAYCSMHWTRALTHTEMGAYAEALENLNLARHHLDQIPNSEEVVESSDISSTWRFLQAMLENRVGTLSGPNDEVESARILQGWDKASNLGLALTERGILKRLCGDLQGACDDLNRAYQVSQEPGAYFGHSAFHIIKHLGYVKYLMKDEAGARADAESALQMQLKSGLKSTRPANETTIDCNCFWDLTKLPINYLNYFDPDLR